MTKRYVTNEDTSVRMFRSSLLDRFTRVHPAVPHVIFLPVIAYMLYTSLQRVQLSTTALLFVGGIIVWSFLEYIMHRFVFHVTKRVEEEVHQVVAGLDPSEAVLPRLHGFNHVRYFLEHGVHHDFPNDSMRLVMPPSMSVPLAVLFYFLFLFLFGGTHAPALFAGLVAGYLAYDTIHYAVHHFPGRTKIGRYLKKHHFRHHYFDSTRDYGVSSPLWDVIFGTLGSRTASKRTDLETTPHG